MKSSYDESTYHAIWDFAIHPYALGDILTWCLDTAVKALANNCTCVHVHCLIDPTRPANIAQPHIHSQNYLSYLAEMLPAFFYHPLLADFNVYGSSDVFDALVSSLTNESRPMSLSYSQWQLLRKEPQAYRYCHEPLNKFFEDHGDIPYFKPIRSVSVRKTLLHVANQSQTHRSYSSLVTLHLRLRQAENIDVGARHERDAVKENWQRLIESANELYPETLFAVLGRPEETAIWNDHDNVIVVKSYLSGLVDEMDLVLESDFFMGTSSGPSMMAMYGQVKHAIFQAPDETLANEAAYLFGVPIGTERMPHSNSTQLFKWQGDSLQQLLSSFAYLHDREFKTLERDHSEFRNNPSGFRINEACFRNKESDFRNKDSVQSNNGCRLNYYLFGTGSGAERVWQRLSTSEYIELLGFVDNDTEKHGQMFKGLPVVSPKFLVDKVFDFIVIGSQYVQEISAQLKQLGIAPEKVLDASVWAMDLNASVRNYSSRDRVASTDPVRKDSFIEKQGTLLVTGSHPALSAVIINEKLDDFISTNALSNKDDRDVVEGLEYSPLYIYETLSPEDKTPLYGKRQSVLSVLDEYADAWFALLCRNQMLSTYYPCVALQKAPVEVALLKAPPTKKIALIILLNREWELVYSLLNILVEQNKLARSCRILVSDSEVLLHLKNVLRQNSFEWTHKTEIHRAGVSLFDLRIAIDHKIDGAI